MASISTITPDPCLLFQAWLVISMHMLLQTVGNMLLIEQNTNV